LYRVSVPHTRDVVLEIVVLVSRPEFCSLGLSTCGLSVYLGLEGSVSAVCDIDQ